MNQSETLRNHARDEARLGGCCVDDPRPALPPPVVHELAARLYGLAGALTPFTSEREQVFRLSTNEGATFVLRIAGDGEAPAMLAFQNRVLAMIATADPTLPVPRLRNSVRGCDLERYEHAGTSYAIRLLSFVPGVPVVDQARSPAFDDDLGRSLARLDRVLARLDPAPANAAMLWDVTRAPRLRPLVEHVRDRARRARVDAVFEALASHVLARLANLPPQVIHNDFNPKNVLVAPEAPDRVAGIIDFGDLANGPRIIDLGVAIARHIDIVDPLARAARIVAGYNDVLPLAESEISLLFPLVCARLAMRAAIWSWRHNLRDPRCDPSQIESAHRLLDHLFHRGAESVTADLRAACRADRRPRRA